MHSWQNKNSRNVERKNYCKKKKQKKEKKEKQNKKKKKER